MEGTCKWLILTRLCEKGEFYNLLSQNLLLLWLRLGLVRYWTSIYFILYLRVSSVVIKVCYYSIYGYTLLSLLYITGPKPHYVLPILMKKMLKKKKTVQSLFWFYTPPIFTRLRHKVQFSMIRFSTRQNESLGFCLVSQQITGKNLLSILAEALLGGGKEWVLATPGKTPATQWY